MFEKYTKKFSLTSYDGFNWEWLSGFEQVVINNGIATYYAVDYGSSRIVTFNQNWVYQSYQQLPFNGTYTTKYVQESFYFSSDDYFYKTNSSFFVISNFHNKNAWYRQFAYDSRNSQFYVTAARDFKRIDVFNVFCSFLRSIILENKPNGLVILNGNILVGDSSSNKISVLKKEYTNFESKVLSAKTITVNKCNNGISSITADSFGYMAISCGWNQTLVTVYDLNGTDMNAQITTLFFPFTTAVDSSGRYVVMTQKSLDIYY